VFMLTDEYDVFVHMYTYISTVYIYTCICIMNMHISVYANVYVRATNELDLLCGCLEICARSGS